MYFCRSLVFIVTVTCAVDAIPIVFKESTPNGESIISFSSSDPNAEKYFRQQFSTRTGFTQLDSGNSYQSAPGNSRSSYSIAVPGKAVAGNGRSFASASSRPFFPFFSFPITPDYGFNSFPNLKSWVRNFESQYDPSFSNNGQVYTATAVSDNGREYSKVSSTKIEGRGKNSEARNRNVRN